MAAVGESGASSGSDDPYARLGLAPGASFDEVQAARSRCLAETDNDPQAKARVEAAYDAVLMARLRERQQGQVSAAAATASQKEESSASASPSLPGVSVLQRLRLPQVTPSMAGMAPSWSLVEVRVWWCASSLVSQLSCFCCSLQVPVSWSWLWV